MLNRKTLNLLAMLLLIVALSLPTASNAADDRYVPVANSSGWIISFDREQNNCVAVPKTAEGLFLIRSSKDALRLVFATPRLTWLQEAKAYDVLLFTDGGRWNGTMTGMRVDQSFGLIVDNPSPKFLAALRSANKLRLQVQGAVLGPYPLSGSDKTISVLSQCIASRDAGAFQPERPKFLPYRQPMAWTKDDYGKTFQGEGWTAKLQGQDNVDGTATAYLMVSYEKSSSDTLKLETAPERGSGTIEVLPLTSGKPSIVFSSYTGGAHCCVGTVAATPDGNLIKQAELGVFDGGGVSFEDLDNDGLYEAATVDQRFLYTFASYASSLAPPQYWKLKNGKFVDVTREKVYQPLIRASLIKHLNRYQSGETGNPDAGFAGGVLAIASLVGQYNSVKASMPTALMNGAPEDGYDICRQPECAVEKRYRSVGESISDRLTKWGYDLNPHLDPASLTFFKSLAANGSFGEGNAEGSCESGPTTFEIKDDKYVSFSGYEMGCDIEQAALLNGSVAATALCSGEGEFWSGGYLIWKSGDGISMAHWFNDISELMPPAKDNQTRKLDLCPVKK